MVQANDKSQTMQFKAGKKGKSRSKSKSSLKVGTALMVQSLSDIRVGLTQRGMTEALAHVAKLEQEILWLVEQEAEAQRHRQEQERQRVEAKKHKLREVRAQTKHFVVAAKSGTLVDRTAQKIGYPSYDRYLKSDHWTTVRLCYAAAWPGCRCVACGSDRWQLHHVCYTRLGREMLRDLIPFCEPCHKKLHACHQANRIPVRDYRKGMQHAFGWSPVDLDQRLDRFYSFPDATVIR